MGTQLMARSALSAASTLLATSVHAPPALVTSQQLLTAAVTLLLVVRGQSLLGVGAPVTDMLAQAIA
jgi:hypothetical protein